MTPKDKRTIWAFANGNQSLRAEAIGAYRKALVRRNVPSVYERFMMEVDNTCPDYGLRARYRAEVLETEV